MTLDTLARLYPDELRPRLTALRHDLHRCPELAFDEVRTSERLYEELSKLPLVSLDRVAGTGLVARIPGQQRDGVAVAVRGDIDALPIQEETDVEFASQVPGIMHACGHDVHASWTVGAAHLLVAHPPRSDVLIVLQPGEETGHGAPRVIESGALDGIGAIFGAHVDMRFDVGTVVAASGNVSASADEFSIQLTGHGAHAGRPHEGADPIVGAAALIDALQTIVSRRVPPGVPSVVTVGTVRAGSAANVVPEIARLTGTLRAADAETRAFLHAELERIAEAVAGVHRLSATVHIVPGTPPLVNDDSCVAVVREAVRSVLGQDAVTMLPVPNLGGEDFAFYLERIPGCFARIGGRGPHQSVVPAHTPRFVPADDAIFVGAAVLAETARRASARLNATK